MNVDSVPLGNGCCCRPFVISAETAWAIFWNLAAKTMPQIGQNISNPALHASPMGHFGIIEIRSTYRHKFLLNSLPKTPLRQ